MALLAVRRQLPDYWSYSSTALEGNTLTLGAWTSTQVIILAVRTC